MSIQFNLNSPFFKRIYRALMNIPAHWIIIIIAFGLAVNATLFSYVNDVIVTYGDSESHLNIAKRVIHSVTPGMAQLGGIWLPLPHIMMTPFVMFDPLWRTGLGGSLVSGFAYIVSCLYIYKLTHLLVKRRLAAFFAFLVFATNPNVLYMQSTPMTELPLIMFFMISSYYFIRHIFDQKDLLSLILAAFFGFCATLSRYDGWFLVAFESLVLVMIHYPFKTHFKELQGKVILFCCFAFLGISLWFLWDYLILGDPLYFTNSQFSAKSQQNEWLARGQLPAYHNLPLAFAYYSVNTMSAAGVILTGIALAGLFAYLLQRKSLKTLGVVMILLVPYIFYVFTLYVGQSVIFIPHLTPVGFDWNMFNVRYGLMMVPAVAFFAGYLVSRIGWSARLLVAMLFVVQFGLYFVGYSQVITLTDGTSGLSAAKRPDAEKWLKDHYDGGLVVIDDYTRMVSIVRSGVPMENIIYIGTKPYWEESLKEPEKHATWIIMQKNDTVWKNLNENPQGQGRLYSHFEKAYTSPEILIFRKMTNKENVAALPTSPQKFWEYQCIDTMKYSRDSAREWMKRADVDTLIEDQIKTISNLGADCVGIATPYDDEFVPYLEKWVATARQYNLKVWFRGNWAAWEGWFGSRRSMTIAQHIDKTRDFITTHPDLFMDGDIFTPSPEAENGGPFAPISGENSDLFRSFLVQQKRVSDATFEQLGKKIRTDWLSMSGGVAQSVLNQETVDNLGNVIAIDHYVPNPESMGSFVDQMSEKYNAKIVLGEFGAPIPDINGTMTEEEQADFVNDLMLTLVERKDKIAGVNYWVLSGGSTTLVNPDGTVREAGSILKRYFDPMMVRGVVRDIYGDVVADAEVQTVGGQYKTRTNKYGEYALTIPAGTISLEVNASGHVDENWRGKGEPGNTLTQNFTMTPVAEDWQGELRLNMYYLQHRVGELFGYKR